MYCNQKISKYLQTFLNTIYKTEHDEESSIKLAKQFTKNDFTKNIILFEMAKQIYKINNQKVVNDFASLAFNERLDIAYLLAFYASVDINNLDIIN